jgi:GMP reductase
MSDLFSYDTICLRPNYSTLSSRSQGDTRVYFCQRQFNLPVIPANMKDVISYDNAKWLSESGYFYIYHRFEGQTSNFIIRANEENLKLISISIGTSDFESVLKDAKARGNRIDFITIDVAHAHHENVKPVISFVRQTYPEAKLIVGNVATREGAKYLTELEVDAIKVGIGGGSICTTRYKTGFHLPTLHSVYEATDYMMDLPYREQIPIIADGGLKYYGDIAKALAFGATMVMSGGWFASCIDSPAKIVHGKKVYRGSTSYEATGENRHIEGRTLTLEEGLTYSQRLQEIKEALQSSISYAGGKILFDLRFVKYKRILPYQ